MTSLRPESMVPYCQPWSSGEELQHIAQAMQNQGGPKSRHYTQACERWLESYTGCHRAFLTPSCTAALEMAAILADIQPGDEVIMSSFTFPSMANAFVLRGGRPVFVDIRPDTLNIDESLIEAAITTRTRAIVAMHYGGRACEMDSIMALAAQHGLMVIEDAAHAIGATYKGRQLGSFGALATFSFHETKNIQCGEGGALLINAPALIKRAEAVRENGTDRARFKRREVPSYTWTDIGSSFIISEFSAAFLWSQLNHADAILAKRRALWQLYHELVYANKPLPDPGHNAHIFYLLAASPVEQQAIMDGLKLLGIQATSHYQPLHSSEAGQRHASAPEELPCTTRVARTLLRLPLGMGMTEEQVRHIAGQTNLLAYPAAQLQLG